MKRILSILLIISLLFATACAKPAPEPETVSNVGAQLEQAELLFSQANYEEVILMLNQVLEVEAANVRGYLRLSDAYLARGERDKALKRGWS